MRNADEVKIIPQEITAEFSFFDLIKERFLSLIAFAGIDILFVSIMAVILISAVWLMGGNVRFFQASVGFPLGIMAVVVLAKFLRTPKRLSSHIPMVFRDWLPFVVIHFIYENLHDIAGKTINYDYANYFRAWDAKIFGVEPTLWIQKYFSPILTDIMSASYALYLVFPLVIMFFLSIWEWRQKFRQISLALAYSFVFGFIGYTLFPTSPPRYFMADIYTDPPKLYGYFLFNKLQGAWDSLSVVAGGAFPSLHVGISCVALIFAYRFRRANAVCRYIWYAYVPLVISLWISTVYLRHHWVIDIFAGLITAVISCWLADFSLKRWNNLRAN